MLIAIVLTIMLIPIMLITIILAAIMPIVFILDYFNDDCHYTKCPFAESHGAMRPALS